MVRDLVSWVVDEVVVVVVGGMVTMLLLLVLVGCGGGRRSDERENSRMICWAMVLSFCSDGMRRSCFNVLRMLMRERCSPSSSRPVALNSARNVWRVYAAWTSEVWSSLAGPGLG